MAAFQAAVNAMPTAWLLAGQAIRVAQDLGLHVSPGTKANANASVTIESR